MKKSEQFRNKMVGFFGRALLVAALGASAMLLSQHAALAADAEDGSNIVGAIGLQSFKQVIDISAGESFSNSMVVINPTEETIDVKVYAAPYTVKGDEYENDYATETAYTEIAQWISFEQEVYTLTPGARVSVPFTITVPANAHGGGQYAAVFAEAIIDESSANTSTVKTIPRAAMLVYAKVDGEIDMAGRVVDQTIKNFYWNPPISTSAMVENTGNMDFTAKVTTTIMSFFGKENATEPIEDEFTIMPDTRRLIAQTWDGSPSLGIFKVRQEVTIMDDEPVVLERTVIIMPLFLLIIIVIALVLLIIWVIAKLKKHRR